MSTSKGEGAVDTLRRAAGRIRDLAVETQGGPWSYSGINGIYSSCGTCVALAYGEEAGVRRGNGAHIALWDPPTALLVAVLLDDAAFKFEAGVSAQAAVALARHILGEASR